MSDLPLKMLDLDASDEFHRCPNADVSACEFCKLLNTFSMINRTLKLRNELESVKLIEDCYASVSGLRKYVDKLTPHLSRFDFDESVKANGHRTFVHISRVGAQKCLYLASEIQEQSRFYTAATHPIHAEKLLDWSRIFRVVLVIMTCLVDFVEGTKVDSLFTSDRQALDKLISMSKERVNLVGFHGRLLAFQFCKSVRIPLRIVSCLMAAFSKIYNTNSIFRHTILSPTDFVHYWRHPTERANRIAKICEEDPLVFFKEFWLVQERGIIKIASNCLGESVEANLELSIPPVKLVVDTPFSSTRRKLTILPPHSYLGTKPLHMRLISHKMRDGCIGSSGTDNIIDASQTLILHLHGGGFVAQSSNSHLIYLKSWAKGAGAPILSVDYSLSPEAPYPRALHEAFYAYVWALQNCHLLGSTAEKIFLAGDSAGGLILTGVTILAIELGMRIPDGLLLAYTPQLLESAVSPARLMSLADPLIPYPALAACLGAYLGKTFDISLANLPQAFIEEPWDQDEKNAENCSRKFMTLDLEELDGVTVPPDDFHLSPLIAPDDILRRFPRTSLISTNFDPCLDDVIELAKRLKELNVPVTLDVINNLPHGFLNFGRISQECYIGIETCFRRLKDFVM